jgi:8-oxo-dGTP pyrophosphatase MutT (NUDIX family)
MKLLFTINKQSVDTTSLSTISRTASRAIIFEGKELVMIQSKKYGEYKFPGGGVRHTEDIVAAMRREVREETGFVEVEVIEEFGKVIELRKALDPGVDVFMMESYYYVVQVGSLQIKQQLDLYEQEYGYEVKCVAVEEAIAKNKTLFGNEHIPWVERETAVLELLLQNNKAF